MLSRIEDDFWLDLSIVIYYGVHDDAIYILTDTDSKIMVDLKHKDKLFAALVAYNVEYPSRFHHDGCHLSE